jgi:hypothetical protein
LDAKRNMEPLLFKRGYSGFVFLLIPGEALFK